MCPGTPALEGWHGGVGGNPAPLVKPSHLEAGEAEGTGLNREAGSDTGSASGKLREQVQAGAG